MKKQQQYISWHTCDTLRSIPVVGACRSSFLVSVVTRDGRIFCETQYRGDGVFGEQDIYALIAELNDAAGRMTGKIMLYKNNPQGDFTNAAYNDLILPKIVEQWVLDIIPDNSTNEWRILWDSLPYPINCAAQGFFYDDTPEYFGNEKKEVD